MHSVRRVVIVLAVLCPRVFALDPSIEISQYAHKAWLNRDGYFRGKINAIAQTPDGYLWLGTDLGLVRFDGVRFVPQFLEGQHLPSDRIEALVAARDGRLWIGTEFGLASWKDGRVSTYKEFEGAFVRAIVEDHGGSIWAASSNAARLCVIQGESFACDQEADRLGPAVGSLYEDSPGNLWVASSTGVWRWKPDRTRFDIPGFSAGGFAADAHGELLLGTNAGLRRFARGKFENYYVSGTRDDLKVRRMFRDRDGSVWIGTVDAGLYHLRQDRWDHFQRSDGLSGDFVRAFLEDREGNLWVATSDGLDRFRTYAIPAISGQQGLSSSAYSVLASTDGSVWIGTPGGLDRWKDGQITAYHKRDGLPDDLITSVYEDGLHRIWISTAAGIVNFENGRFRISQAALATQHGYIAGDSAGNLWIIRSRDSLLHLTKDRAIESTPWSRLLQDPNGAISLAPDPARKGIWIGFYSLGLAFVKDGQLRTRFTNANGLGAGFVSALRLEKDGVLWASTQGGLSRVKDGGIATLTSKNGLPCDTVHWMMEDDDRFVWLYTACGLVRLSRAELDAWSADSKRSVQTTHFDESDGVPSEAVTSLNSPLVTKSADGRLWFVNGSGVSILDPRRLEFNKLPPPVHIERIIADDKTYDLKPGLRLPANVRNLRIEYTALSLVAPEKVHFKYMLEGQDRDWKEVINDRQAQYTNLAPRHYRFRVIASNNSGVWNETGDTLKFSIAPAYYQTNWFRASVVAAFFVGLWGLYRSRLRRLAREYNAQMEGRVEERLRVARDLHDTLLQSFQGLMPVFQTARNLLPGQSDRAAEVLDEGLHDAANAIVEGRNAIQNLRAKPSLDPDLGSLLNAAGQELAQSPEADGSAPAFRVVVEGSRQPLAPLLRDEVYRIGREVLRNAFRHAHASRIEAEIRYNRDMFRLRIRDDGKGIDSSILKQGARTGHFGLPGMHERANKIGARLKIWSEPGAGTEAELTVPARIAYEKFSTNNGWWARLGRRLGLIAPNREA